MNTARWKTKNRGKLSYHRPVTSFNKGKQSEHRERRHFVESRCRLG